MKFVAFVSIIISLVGYIEAQACGKVVASKPSIAPTGQDAYLGEFPWTVSVRFDDEDLGDHIHICGGAILNQNWIVTAAHCIENYDANVLLVLAGVRNYQLEDTNSYQLTYITKKIVHEYYNSESLANDIALVQLENSLTYNDYVQSVCLPSEQLACDPTNNEVSGWNTGDSDKNMQHFDITVLDPSTCAFIFTYSGRQYSRDCQLCGITMQNSSYVTDGFDGSPMTHYNNVSSSNYLCGLVAEGFSADSNLPDIYTSVPCYVDWINENMQ